MLNDVTGPAIVISADLLNPVSMTDTPSVSNVVTMIYPVGLNDLGFVAPPTCKVTVVPALIPFAIKYLTPSVVALRQVYVLQDAVLSVVEGESTISGGK